ncbi:MAG TPA: type II toxin-antitoxin system death-on-curing family toxin [Candidatus Baltobacteraceae bacterium]|nr:type II toxin-antitoxin system death-on-curing family toxin [Candidatus Baltobacteraceae bacterium]
MEWLDEDVVLAIHEAQIAEHGGGAGLRDRGLLVSALERPKNSAQYSGADVPELAALYAIGIIRNHPFVDGNKRVGAVLLDVFLELHHVELTATDGELVEAILGVASGTLSDEAFTAWVREHCSAK